MNQPFALFTGVPFVGHLYPLLYQADALHKRGWDVGLASFEVARPFVEKHFPQVRFISLGETPDTLETAEEFLEKVCAEKSWLKSIIMLLNPLEKLWPIMYDALQREVRIKKPDILVVDFASTAGIDLAESEGIPYVVNNADLLSVIPATLLPYASGVPLLLSGHSIHKMGWKEKFSSYWNLKIAIVAARIIQNPKANKLRKSRSLGPVDSLTRLRNKTIVVNSAFGLEYQRPLPPSIHMVGPVFPNEIEALDPEMNNYLADPKPVVYVNLGTLSAPSGAQLEYMCQAFESENYRVLWVMRESIQKKLPTRLAENIRIETWLSSPRAVLQHPNVKVFVSHCGVNSVHESIDAGTPLVGIPMFAAQNDMGIRVQDSGIGVLLNKVTFTAESLQKAILEVMNDPCYTENTRALKSSFTEAGGVEKAVDIIEKEAGIMENIIA